MKTLMVLFVLMMSMMSTSYAQFPTLIDEFEQPRVPAYTDDKTLTIGEIHALIDADTSSWFRPGTREFAKGMAYAYRMNIVDNPMAAEYFKAACKASSPDWSRPHPVYIWFWSAAEGGRLAVDRDWVDYMESTCPELGTKMRNTLNAVDHLIEHWDDALYDDETEGNS
jgi:hypothetical protein